MKVPFLKPAIREEDVQAAADAMRSGWLVLGERTKEFECELADYLGCSHVVFTNSCTCSLELMLEIMGIQKGDEVITTPLTYWSSVTPILQCGATPVFVDVEAETGNINVDLVESAITKNTKAILPVHLYGQMVDMKKLSNIATAYNLSILEDAAHAIESQRDGVRPGQNSAAACFSFHTAKNLAAGYGGAIATNNEETSEKLRILRKDGTKMTSEGREMVALGRKYLGTEAQAAMLSSQLKRLDRQNDRREYLYNRYAEAFTKHNIAFNTVLPQSKHAYHMMVIWINPKSRSTIRQQLADFGIETSIHYNPVHLEPFFRQYKHYKEGTFPIAEQLGTSTITLPLYCDLTDEEQDYVIEKVTVVIASL